MLMASKDRHLSLQIISNNRIECIYELKSLGEQLRHEVHILDLRSKYAIGSLKCKNAGCLALAVPSRMTIRFIFFK